MDEPQYIHGTNETEQERLAGLNRMTNPPFIEFLDLQSTDHVLEVGSGLGILANEVARRVPEGSVTGIEFSSAQIRSACAIEPNVHFTRGDAHHLPFPDDHFDVVYCRYVLEHVREPQTVLREMRRVLKPGGRALAQENNMMMVALDPDCPRFEALLLKFCELQRQIGGDALIGKRLYSLFHTAGFQHVTLSYQPEIHPANRATFKPWMNNLIGVLESASALLQAHRLATADEIKSTTDEIRSLMERNDASFLFHWDRVDGIK